MADTDWIFDVLYDLSEGSEKAGMQRLSRLLEKAMDVYVEEERRLKLMEIAFQSNRRGWRASELNRYRPPASPSKLRPFKSDWERAFEPVPAGRFPEKALKLAG